MSVKILKILQFDISSSLTFTKHFCWTTRSLDHWAYSLPSKRVSAIVVVWMYSLLTRPLACTLHSVTAVAKTAQQLFSLSSTTSSTASSTTSMAEQNNDPEYPGTSVERMQTCMARAKTLGAEALSGEWEGVRRLVLWAGGLKDLPRAVPGQGLWTYTVMCTACVTCAYGARRKKGRA